MKNKTVKMILAVAVLAVLQEFYLSGTPRLQNCKDCRLQQGFIRCSPGLIIHCRSHQIRQIYHI